MKVMETLKKINRTVLEMQMGTLFLGMVCQIAGALIVDDQKLYACSLWFGICLSMVSCVHIYRTLDMALDFDEKNATKIITRGYLTRYVLLVVILSIIMVTGIMNPLVVFMAYMSLKVTAYLQPVTHKLCNKMFHETDPVPTALPMEEASNAEKGESLSES